MTSVTPQLAPEAKVLDIKEKYQLAEKITNEEYKIWKKTSPMLYDLMYSQSLDWPSLTVEWTKDYKVDPSRQTLLANIMIGTHTTGSAQNHLKHYTVELPAATSPDYQPVTDTPPTPINRKGNQFDLVREWEHPGEVNKLRLNHDLGLIATQTNYGDILIYDFNKKDSSTFEKTLKFHSKEGFGLEWNPDYETGQLLSSSEDHKIALWDLKLNPDAKVLKPIRTFETHDSIVNDVSWNKQIKNLFASVGDDKSLQIHDLRMSTTNYKPVVSVSEAHDDTINAVEFNPEIGTLLATGSSDGFVSCWDLRNMSTPIRKLYGHSTSVINLKFKDTLLMSSSIDTRVLIWNLNRLNDGEFDLKEYEKKKSDYVDPCLVFMHGGHTGRICEADWHPVLNNVVVSCAEDNLMEVWRPRHVESEEEEDEEEEEEESSKAVEEEAKDEDAEMS
ncbi:hypothetical protein CANARDRAFT_9248 [[Candida] arabinofermentans NRRL YB-2248]|uniref:Histone-binding protein RBBP4-like N-terminal domain-containing protein n=1 Tax=[Candida] arabinofermentans NRRL YB-2248 TaxID=983967 RepID=A0A1E4SW21_9ASCO|nr:hypothetical protein CANARDRAFT_9248 [[Candida] arabinofermentans NRRL YB-2248]